MLIKASLPQLLVVFQVIEFTQTLRLRPRLAYSRRVDSLRTAGTCATDGRYTKTHRVSEWRSASHSVCHFTAPVAVSVWLVVALEEPSLLQPQSARAEAIVWLWLAMLPE